MQLVDCLQGYATPPAYLWPMTSDYLTGDYAGGYALTEVMQAADGDVLDVETDYYTSTPIFSNGTDSLAFFSSVQLPVAGNIADSFTIVMLVKPAGASTFSGTDKFWWQLYTRAWNDLDTDRSRYGLGWTRTADGGNQHGFFMDGTQSVGSPPYYWQVPGSLGSETYEILADNVDLTGTDDYVMAWRWNAATSTLSLWRNAQQVTQAVMGVIPENFPIREVILKTWDDQDENNVYTYASHVAWWSSALSDEALGEISGYYVNGGCGATPITIDMQDVTIETSITAALEMKTRVELDGGAP